MYVLFVCVHLHMQVLMNEQAVTRSCGSEDVRTGCKLECQPAQPGQDVRQHKSSGKERVLGAVAIAVGKESNIHWQKECP